MKWTPAQESALSLRQKNLLLSAAAGSGKTAVLVERVIRRITDETDPVDVNRFLILTFTRAAAAEMKSRIGQTLSARIRETGEDLAAAPTAEKQARFRRLSRELSLLGSASVTTIDAFCKSLLQQYFYKLDLDPDFRILSDEGEKEILRQDVLSEVLLAHYEKAEQGFLDLVDLFSADYQDKNLRATLLDVYDFSLALPFPEDFLRRLPAVYDTKSAKTPDELPWFGALLTKCRLLAASWVKRYMEFLPLIEGDPAFEPYHDLLGNEYYALEALLKAETWSKWYETLGDLPFDRLPAAKKKLASDPEAFLLTKDRLQEIRNDVKTEVTRIRTSYFFAAPERIMGDLAETAPLIRAFSDVLLDFHAAYMARKKKEGLMEFSDTEYYSLRLLMTPDSTPEHITPSETALELREKFKEVMVDEYQDTNELQDLITALVSTGNDRFLVGDIKQSIYRFRLADPAIFLQKYERYTGKDADSCRIDLNQNFRSSPEILRAINFIFAQIMQEEGGLRPLELTYGRSEALHPGRAENAGPNALTGDVELMLLDLSDKEETEEEIDEELEKTDLEARMIALRIRELMDSGATVTAKDGTPRPLTYDDIVILLRAADGPAPAIVRALRQQGIPAAANRAEDFFSAIEVEILWAILKLLDNPRQDIALAAVLRFPLIGLSEESLARLHLASPSSLWDALRDASSILPEGEALRVIRFQKTYRSWRETARQEGTAPLIEAILGDLSLLSYFSGMEGGALRRAHLLSFYEAARAWDEGNKGGLYHFLRYLSQTKASGKAIKEAASVAAAEGAVRIMTIHKSKGLEFPVVFLASASKKFNQKDSAGIGIVSKKLGLALQHFDRGTLTRRPTLCHAAAADLSRDETLAEEARLLYVAMTRARDKLIVTAAEKDADAMLAARAAGLTGCSTGTDPLPAYRVLSAASYLDWILPAALRSRSLAPLWDRMGLIPAYASPKAEDEPHFLCRLYKTADLAAKDTDTADTASEDAESEAAEDLAARFLAAPAAGDTAWLARRFSWRYAHPGAAETPAKLTATAAVKLAEAEKEENMPSELLAAPIEEAAALPPDFTEPPAFLAGEEDTCSGTSYGTLMHKAMEMLDLRTLPADENAIRDAIRKLAEENTFTAEEAETLLSRRQPAKSILAFLRGPLGRLMREADVIRKEMPFSILLPAREFYPAAEEGEEIFLQGTIDCLLEKDGHLAIIDYKTDRAENGEILREHYHRQLEIYADAAERILGKPVETLCLWAFRLNEKIDIPR